jgi:UDP-glucose:(heptosyl)LPS alpha-1,3-glucosyltransferase
MKIALVHKKYTTHGGTERYLVGLSKFLVKNNHQVHVFTASIDPECRDEKINFHQVSAWGKHLGIDKYTFSKNVKKELKKYDFDIIQTFSRVGFGDVIRIGGGCHQIFLDKYFNSLENPLYKLKKKIEYKLSLQDYFTRYYEAQDFKKGNYKKIVAVSQMVKNEIIANYHVPPADIIVNHNGVDIGKFNPGNREEYRREIRKKHEIANDDFMILFLGTGFKRKGLKYIIKALPDIPKIKLMVVGRGNIKRYRKLAAEFSVLDRTVFVGPIKNVEAYYAAADIFVFPSIYDPCANVTLEAMASGLPVITSESNGASDVINHGKNGYILDSADDTHDIKKYIKFLIDNKILNEFSKKSRCTMLDYSKEKNYQKMLDIYRDIDR